MNNTFSLQRFMNYAKSDFLVNKRLYMLLFGGAVAIIMIIYYLCYMNLDKYIGLDDVSASMMMLSSAFSFSVMLVVLMLIVNASISFRTFHNKGLASVAMMLPVSKIEKFIHAFLLNICVIPLVLFAIMMAINYGWHLSLGQQWKFLVHEQNVVIVLSCVATFVVYFCGSIFFRRFQFLITLLLLFAFWVILVMILVNDNFISQMVNSWEFSTIHRVTVSNIVLACIIVIFTVIAWLRFRKFQITK